MATGSSLTQNYSRSPSEVQGDLHKVTGSTPDATEDLPAIRYSGSFVFSDTTTVFLQNGFPPHNTYCVKQVLHRDFSDDDRIISCHFRIAWPPRSPALFLATFGCEDTSSSWFTAWERRHPLLRNSPLSAGEREQIEPNCVRNFEVLLNIPE
ncbi:hypothetical protein TNCV_3880731 [Trichonephila clavipes]|nr:hypothetical protein TNCV_3880731 [Trichonephila clavipes]